MQIFKAILLTCVLTAAACPVYLRAEDTAAQAAARAALQEKMRELKGPVHAGETQPELQPATPVPTPTPLPKPTISKSKSAAPKPVGAAAPAAPAPFTMPEGADPNLIEQARQANRARMAELQSHKSTAIPVGHEAPVPPPAYQPMTESAPVTTVVTPAVTTEVKAAAPTAADLRAAKAREAAAKKAEQAEAAKARKAQAEAAQKAKAEAQAAARATASANARANAATAKPAKAVTAAKPVKKTKPAAKVEAAVSLTPLEGPASNLPATKEMALQTLLEQYKADKISSEEYHQQRAKILAEP